MCSRDSSGRDPVTSWAKRLAIAGYVCALLAIAAGWGYRVMRSPERRARALLQGIAGLDSPDEARVPGGWVGRDVGYGQLVQQLRALSPEATDTLIAALSDPSLRVQGAAATALGGTRDPRAISALCKVLKDRKSGESVRYRALRSLGEIGGPEAIDGIAELMLDIFERGCVSFNPATPDAKPPWVELRVLAAKELGRAGDPRAVEALTACARSDRPDELASAACMSLAEIGDDTAVEALLSVMRTGGGYARVNAAAALSLTGRRDLRGQVLKAVRDGDSAAIPALGGLGDAADGEAIVPYLSHGDYPVRSMAARALGRLGYQPALVALRQMASQDQDPYVRRVAAEAVRKMVAVRGDRDSSSQP